MRRAPTAYGTALASFSRSVDPVSGVEPGRATRIVLGTAVLGVVCGAAWHELTAPSSATRGSATIDCPPAPSRSGGDRPSDGPVPVWRVGGVIGRLDLAHRTLAIDGATLSIDVDTVILVDCKRAPLRALREGGRADVVYEERDGRNVVIVVEAEGEQH